MKKIVINDCFGGFGLSYKGLMRYAELKGMSLYAYVYDFKSKEKIPWDGTGKEPIFLSYSTNSDLSEDSHFWRDGIERDDPALIQVIEELGKEADGKHSSLKIVQIPDDVKWYIAEYDGDEHVAEHHRTWYE